jgi:hypothetical protein
MRHFSLAALVLAIPVAARADTCYPMVMSIAPVAVQTGTTTECDVSARYDLRSAYKVFVSGEGVTGEAEPATVDPKESRPSASKLKVRFRVAADAMPGAREVRIATRSGVSTVGQLVVVSDPVTREAADNDTVKGAQEVALPATLCGAFEKAEDVDHFKFKAAAGQAVTFHVHCQRLQDKIHDLQEHADPILTLRNSAGTVVAVNDNTFGADPLLHHKFESAGEYFLEIRDVRYGGNEHWQYCVEASDRPFVTNVHPLRVAPGAETKLTLVGHNIPADVVATLALPADTPEGPQLVRLTLANGEKSNPVPVVVSRLPEVAEAERDNDTPAKAQTVAVPSGIAGRVEREGDVDCYSFEAKAGEMFAFAVIARGQQSAMDPVLRILNEKGERVTENDDFLDRFIHADSRIAAWLAPSDGKFVVEVRDAHHRGGPPFVYFLRVTRGEPRFDLELDTDKTMLAPGTSGVIFVRSWRRDGFGGDIQLAVEGLPPGVTATCGKILASRIDGCIHLTAAPDAKIGAAEIRVTGTGSHPIGDGTSLTLTSVAWPLQEIYMPGGGRHHFPVSTHVVSVGDPLHLTSVKLSATEVALKPGESRRIDLTVDRVPGFKQSITLDAIYQHLGNIFGDSLPPGVTIDESASQTLLTGEQSTGYITLRAAPDAPPVERQLVPIMAHVSINFAMKFTYCGEPLHVTVAPP